METEFVASFSPIVTDPDASATFYRDGLGVRFEHSADDYLCTHAMEGVKPWFH